MRSNRSNEADNEGHVEHDSTHKRSQEVSGKQGEGELDA